MSDGAIHIIYSPSQLDIYTICQIPNTFVIVKVSLCSVSYTHLKHSRDFGGGLDDGELMKLAGLARNTYYKYKRELKEESAEE